MKQLLLKIWEKILDNLITTMVLAIFAFLAILLESLTGLKPLTKLFVPILLWPGSGWVALVLVIVWLCVRYPLSKRRLSMIGEISPQPKYHASFDRQLEEKEYAGVIWKIIIGSDLDPNRQTLFKESIRVWPHERPYCPNCDYELDREWNRWRCMPCKKAYKIPRYLKKNTWDQIQRNYQRLLVQRGHNNFSIGAEDREPLSVVLRRAKNSTSLKS